MSRILPIKDFNVKNLDINSFGDFLLSKDGEQIVLAKRNNTNLSFRADYIWLYGNGDILAYHSDTYSLHSITCNTPQLKYISKEIFDGKYRITKDEDKEGMPTIGLIYDTSGREVYKYNYWKDIVSIDNNLMTIEVKAGKYTVVPVKKRYSVSDFPFYASKIIGINNDECTYEEYDSKKVNVYDLKDLLKTSDISIVLSDKLSKNFDIDHYIIINDNSANLIGNTLLLNESAIPSKKEEMANVVWMLVKQHILLVTHVINHDFNHQERLLEEVINDDIIELLNSKGVINQSGTCNFKYNNRINQSILLKVTLNAINADAEAYAHKKTIAEKLRIISKVMLEQSFSHESIINSIYALYPSIDNLLDITNATVDYPDLFDITGKPVEGKEDEAHKRIIEDVIHMYPVSSSSKYDDQHSPKREASMPIKVIFDDGTTFDEKKAVNVFQKAIEYIGIEKVKALNLKISSSPMIAINKDEIQEDGGYRNAAHQLSNGMWLSTKISNIGKVNKLKEISKKLNIGLKVVY